MNRAWNGPAAIAGGLLIALLAGAWLMYETRGTTLWFDEWLLALQYRDGLHTFIAPHNGHPTLVPFTIYRLLFATVGIDHSAPYRVVGIAAHLLVVALLYVYSARRAGAAVGFLAAGSILVLGPGWQNIIWPLQVGWLISIACGLGALLALDRRDRRGDITACVLLVVCVSSSGPGVAIAAGLLVEVLRGRGLRSAWIVAAPLALFAVWYLAYQDSSSVRSELSLAPGFAADSAAATFSALAGLAGPLIGDEPVTLAWGRPLAVAAFALLLWRLWRMGTVPTRVLTLLAILAAFWFLTAIQRAGVGPAESSRYVAVAAVFVVALIVELLAGVAISRPAWLVIGAVAVLIALANVGDMRSRGALPARPVAADADRARGGGDRAAGRAARGADQRDRGVPAGGRPRRRLLPPRAGPRHAGDERRGAGGGPRERAPRGGRRAHEDPSRRPDADQPGAEPRHGADRRRRRGRPGDALRRLRRVRAQPAPGRPRRSRRSS